MQSRYRRITSSCLIYTGHLLLSLIVLASLESINLPAGVHSAFIILPAFIFLNIIYVYGFKLQSEAKQFWTYKKSAYLLPAFAAGSLISLAPLLILIFTGQIAIREIHIGELYMSSVVITFCIVSWEELWFRSVILNYCERNLSPVYLSLLAGLLFMLMHILNPKIDLLKVGPALFFAGALLTLLYFYYKTIWVSIGLHFGNNLSGTIFHTDQNESLVFNEDGYFGALLLAILFWWYARKKYSQELI